LLSDQGECRSAPCAMATLVSFDVDGTLIHSVGERSNYLHKEAFAHCFREVCGVDTNIDVIKHHGGTDPLIIKKVLEHSGVEGDVVMERMADLQASMCGYFQENVALAAQGLEVLPGVVELLKALQSKPNVITCLVTGNLEPIGWGKMQAIGLAHLFSTPKFGGFGSDYCSGNTAEMWRDRGEMIRIAGKKADELFPGDIREHYHIGDAPQDLYAAAAAGVNCIGVGTGVYSVAELEDLNTGAIVLGNLGNVEEVLQALGLGSDC